MSETSTETTAPTGQHQNDSADKPLGENGEKALREERARAGKAERELKAANARLAEIEQANLSELEKAQRVATESAAALADAQASNLRMKVALEAGLPLEDVDRIKGATEDELLADAKSLAGRLGKTAATPRPDPSQGARGGDPGQSTAQQFAATVDGMFST